MLQIMYEIIRRPPGCVFDSWTVSFESSEYIMQDILAEEKIFHYAFFISGNVAAL